MGSTATRGRPQFSGMAGGSISWRPWVRSLTVADLCWPTRKLDRLGKAVRYKVLFRVMIRQFKATLLYVGIVLASALVAFVLAEAWLSRRAAPRSAFPFYNRLYPYVMFRPQENARYISDETFAMSHHKSRVYHYTNGDGFRVSSPDYKLPKAKPAGQFRVAVLGGSAVQTGTTFETTLPGSLKTCLARHYPGRDIEVINAGIVSAVSRQSIVHLALTVSEYKPDLVILYDGANDIGLPMTYESRPNFPYNFQALDAAWEEYRRAYQQPLFSLLLERSHVYRAMEARVLGDHAPPRLAGPPFYRPNVVAAERVIQDRAFVQNHIAEHLSNWRQLIKLSAAYNYEPVCVLQPAGVLERGYAVPQAMTLLHVDRATAERWIEAFSALYLETGRQIERLRVQHPGVLLIDLKDYLRPAQKYFWDGVHVYDEINLLLAERIYQEIKPKVDAFWRKQQNVRN